MRRVAPVALLAGVCACTTPATSSAEASIASELVQWGMARCIALSAQGTEYEQDAKASVGALTELGEAQPDSYGRIDAFLKERLANPLVSKSGASLTTLSCVRLASDPAFLALVQEEAGPVTSED